MFRGSVGDIIEPSLARNRAKTLFAELPGCTINLNKYIFINRMNVFISVNRFTVTITAITGGISTGTIAASSNVTIYSTMDMTTPTISSTSTMTTSVGLFESRTVRMKIITIIFIAFATITTWMVSVIIYPLIRCYVYFRNRNVSEGTPMVIIEKNYMIILKIPTNPNLTYLA